MNNASSIHTMLVVRTPRNRTAPATASRCRCTPATHVTAWWRASSCRVVATRASGCSRALRFSCAHSNQQRTISFAYPGWFSFCKGSYWLSELYWSLSDENIYLRFKIIEGCFIHCILENLSRQLYSYACCDFNDSAQYCLVFRPPVYYTYHVISIE